MASVAMDQSRHHNGVISLAGASGQAVTDWNHVKERHAVVLLFDASELSDGPKGVDEADIDRSQAFRVVEILAPSGADRRSVAAAIHQRSPTMKRSFLAIDGAMVRADQSVVSLLGSFSPKSPEIQPGVVFIDSASALGADARRAIDHYAAAVVAAPSLPRLIVGSTEDEGGIIASEADSCRLRVRPLAQRQDDVPVLAQRLLRGLKNGPELAPDAWQALASHAWPGDVEELELVLKRLAVSHPGATVSADELKRHLSPGESAPTATRSLADMEREHIYRVLDDLGWNRTRSAKALGIDVKTLYNKLKRYEARSHREARA